MTEVLPTSEKFYTHLTSSLLAVVVEQFVSFLEVDGTEFVILTKTAVLKFSYALQSCLLQGNLV